MLKQDLFALNQYSNEMKLLKHHLESFRTGNLNMNFCTQWKKCTECDTRSEWNVFFFFFFFFWDSRFFQSRLCLQVLLRALRKLTWTGWPISLTRRQLLTSISMTTMHHIDDQLHIQLPMPDSWWIWFTLGLHFLTDDVSRVLP